MPINEHYQEPLGTTKENFINFIKVNNENVKDCSQREIDFLAKRVAQNMFLFPGNIETAKSDYISLLGLLLKKGIIFPENPANIDKER